MTDLAAVPAGLAARLRMAVFTRAWAWFAALTIGIAAFYIAIQAPVIDPPNYLDPWIYTALFVNFKFIFHTFGWAYYPSRLPWIIPGIIVHSVLPPVAAFFVLHSIFFFGGGLFTYLLVRRFAGPSVALVTYGVLLLSPLFYDAYSNDYPDGALITYLLGGVYFGLTAGESPRPRLRAFMSGFFFACALGTNLFAGLVIASLLLVYAAVRVDGSWLRAVARRDIGLGAAGAFALLLVCGTFSKANDGEFLFFMPSVRALQTINVSDYKAAGSSWMLEEPQLLIPAFVSLCLLLLAAGLFAEHRWTRDAGSRFAIGAAACTVVLYAAIVAWEFAFTGNFLETSYYFSLFNVDIALCIASIVYLLVTTMGRSAALVPATLAAAVAPTIFVFLVRVLPVGRRGAVVIVILMAITLVCIAARRVLARIVGPAATSVGLAVLVAFSSAYAADAGTATRSIFVRNTYHERRDVQAVAMQLIGFMRDKGLQKRSFQFWYNPKDDYALNGIQSVYLWADSWVGLDLPHVDQPMRALLESRKPSTIVLLCREYACHGAPSALTSAGYRVWPLAERLLVSGHERVWARAFTVPKFAVLQPLDPTVAFYRPAQSPFSKATSGNLIGRWSFANGEPKGGWSGAALHAAAAAHGGAFATSSRKWDYEFASPKIELAPGSYTIYARGRVHAGGLDLGALNDDSNVWIEQRFYWQGQKKQFASGWMSTPFAVTKTTHVQIVLSNWVPETLTSRWQLSEIILVRNS